MRRRRHDRSSSGERQICPGWCDLQDDPEHAGLHCAFIGEITLPTGPSYVVFVTAEAEDARPYCMLTLGLRVGYQTYGRAMMSWEMAERLAAMLIDGKRRYAR